MMPILFHTNNSKHMAETNVIYHWNKLENFSVLKSRSSLKAIKNKKMISNCTARVYK